MRSDIRRVRRRPARAIKPPARPAVQSSVTRPAAPRPPSAIQPAPLRQPAVPPRVAASAPAPASAPPKSPPRVRPAPAPYQAYRPTGLRPKTIVLALAVALAVVIVGVRAQASVTSARGDLAQSVQVARQALEAAKERLQASDLVGAEQQFKVAEQALSHANQTLASRGLVGGIAAGQGSGDIRTGQQMLSAGEDTARSGQKLLAEVKSTSAEAAHSDQGFFRAGEVLNRRLPAIHRDLADLDREFKLLDLLSQRAADSGNPELRAAGRQFTTVLPSARTAVADARQGIDALPQFLGDDQFSRYLLLFQNPAELRPTGGFIGTYGRLTLDGGKIKELTVDSIYNPANQANQVIKDKAPVPYARFFADGQSSVWAMQDANWSPDFPTSAKRFAGDYVKSGGPSSDGVIAVTTTPIERMIGVLGPIEMPEYGYTLTSENFRTLIQNDQESRSVAGDQDPKKILRDLVPKLMEKVRQATPEQQNQVVQILSESLKNRDIQAYFTDDTLERLAEKAGVSGKVRPSADTFSVIDTNIAGKKSSAEMAVTLHRTISIAPSGQVTGQVSVLRRYTGTGSQDINKNYTRILLPPGTEVGDTAGWYEFDFPRIYQEDGVTVVGGWTDVNPGEEREVTAAYTLPKKIDLTTGQLAVQYTKQAGTAVQVVTDVTLPDGYAWDGVPGVTVNGNQAHFEGTATTDLQNRLSFRKLP